MQFHEDSKTRGDRLNSLLKCSILRNLMYYRNSRFATFIELFTLRKPPNSYEIDIQVSKAQRT